ncbi:MAG TPA: hypothetical protein PK093_09040 [Phycisphaerae bacterium]|nr:hypothetical protein [Phycisphaerae bacterium]
MPSPCGDVPAFGKAATILLLAFVVSYATPVAAETDAVSKDDLLAYVEAYSSVADTPRSYRNWLPELRRAAYGEAWENSKKLADITWVLVRHEWLDYKAATSPLTRQAAAWRLDRAAEQLVEEFRKDPIPTARSTQRLAISRFYVDSIAATDRPLDPRDHLAMRGIARQRLSLALSPSNSAGPNNTIQLSVQGVFREASDALIKSVTAKRQAITTMRYAYGGLPNADMAAGELQTSDGNDILSPEQAYGALSQRERAALYESEAFRKVSPLLEAAEKEQSFGDGFESLIQAYATLRITLEFPAEIDAVSLRIERDGEGNLVGRAPDPLDNVLKVKHYDDVVRSRLMQIGGHGNLGDIEENADAATLRQEIDRQLELLGAGDPRGEDKIAYRIMDLMAELAKRDIDIGQERYIAGVFANRSLTQQIRETFDALKDRFDDRLPPPWLSRFEDLDKLLKDQGIPVPVDRKTQGPSYPQLISDLADVLSDRFNGNEALLTAVKEEVKKQPHSAADAFLLALGDKPTTQPANEGETTTKPGGTQSPPGNKEANSPATKPTAAIDNQWWESERQEENKSSTSGLEVKSQPSEPPQHAEEQQSICFGSHQPVDAPADSKQRFAALQRYLLEDDLPAAHALLEVNAWMHDWASQSDHHLALGLTLVRSHGSEALRVLAFDSAPEARIVRLITSQHENQQKASELAALRKRAESDLDLDEQIRLAERYVRSVRGLNLAIDHLSRVEEGQARLELTLEFATATRMELLSRQPSISLADAHKVVDQALANSIEHGLIHDQILTEAADLKTKFTNVTEAIDKLAKTVARQYVAVSQIRKIVVATADRLREFIATKDQRESRMTAADNDLNELFIATGFADPPLTAAVVELSNWPDTRNEDYPSYRVYRYMMTGSVIKIEEARRKANSVRTNAERGVTLEELGQDFVQWLRQPSVKEGLTAVKVEAAIRRWRARQEPAQRNQ